MTTFIKRGIIVSCQALIGEPLHGGDAMVKMAKAAQLGGAVGIRTNGSEDIAAIKREVPLPLIGLIKRNIPGSDVFITPTLEEVQAVVKAGADIVAMDVTDRENRLEIVRELLEYVHQAGKLAMADVSTYEEGVQAEQMGFDYVSTTLSGYTSYSIQGDGPDIELVKKLSAFLRVPVFMEGKVWRPEEALAALQAGAQNVVVGSAITRPQLITESYTSAVEQWLADHVISN
ncbi:N-acetylmannosamine-6-phosphate 2-epimerase [Paenibacillus monticola]|uniref:Putative N-acetylmannosamine-6-phosphate 2-epimerase n=1 Tax=Paenibacillus monticola TaxID=2666075 RepID=A0A7X2H4F4_9BACL|nr:N-acetylmannosamine-6-phosphate 2-epimerase [Paenibacillus monticola]MRN53263.1 putative N-acetylmannosamine-6-phosphate 2-epimerase [Paenibacillus monticola]